MGADFRLQKDLHLSEGNESLEDESLRMLKLRFTLLEKSVSVFKKML
jgi:hypothetical protein